MQSIQSETRIGYIGVDILNNATICNEATALLERGTPLELVSVYRFQKPTYHQNDSLQDLNGRIEHLYPIKPLLTCWDLFRAPILFGGNFFKTVFKALTGKVEGRAQRLKMLGHLIPAIKLALHWRNRNLGHIHCQWAHTATTIGMHAAELLGIGFSFMGHANDLFVHRVALEDKIKRARFILCISEYHRRFFAKLGAAPNRLSVVYCGISLERFQEPKSAKTNSRKIVSIGRLVEKKGFDDLIAACGLLRDRGIEFECVIAGSGPEEDSLRQLITNLNLENHVRITGETMLQEAMPDFIRSARLFSLPCVQDSDGDMDGLPQVLIESMACRVPAVSTFLVGIPDLIRHEQNGLLVESRNVKACADAMQLLLTDDICVQELGRQAESWVKRHFGRDELATRVDQILCEAASQPGTSPPSNRYPATPGSVASYNEPRFYGSRNQAPTTRNLAVLSSDETETAVLN